jgi:hypothetical protein
VRHEVPLGWERLLWSGRPARLTRRLAGERYVLTDFRLVRVTRRSIAELALSDIGDVHRDESRLDRLLGTSTLVVHGRRRAAAPPIVLTGVRHGAQLAALLELLSGDPRATLDDESVRATLAWTPRPPGGDLREALGGLIAVVVAIAAVVIGLHGKAATPVVHGSEDPIAPNGVPRNRQEIAAFMERDVMPWARETLGRIKGGSDRITCETCHGPGAEARDWKMPSVAALPLPEVRERGWEIYSASMDAQMRNAIYGYGADSEKQDKAAFMREVVVPGMAQLLHRPAYDFTRPYDYNRARDAIGCYHCHRVK